MSRALNHTITNIRKDLFRMMHRSGSSHIGSCLSIVEILYTLYFDVLNIDPAQPSMPDRDVFVLSKGHASASLYATLAARGFFPREQLEGYYMNNGSLPGHLDMTAVPGIECSAGSLGHGLSVGLGMAIGRKRKGLPSRVFVLVGDGECNEGSVWEAVMLAGTLGQDNLVLIIDFNHLQGFGGDVIKQDNLDERLSAFGWDTVVIDGHDLVQLKNALTVSAAGKPRAIVANTIKGRGVSFTTSRMEWHYKSPNDDQLREALRELGE